MGDQGAVDQHIQRFTGQPVEFEFRCEVLPEVMLEESQYKGLKVEIDGDKAVGTMPGEDKPLKYPDMFHTSDVCIINKIDLMPHLNFDLNRLKDYALQVNPNLQFFEVSATTGEGMQAWYSWLKEQLKKS